MTGLARGVVVGIAYLKAEPNAIHNVGLETLITVVSQAPIPFTPIDG